MSNERRHYSRIAFHTPAHLVLSDRNIEVVVVDLSLKGALVHLPADTHLENGAGCTLRVRLDAAGSHIRMEMSVTHVRGAYAGLACHNIDLDSVTHLRRLVELNLGDEKLLERELSALVGE
ncbi:MAG: PilZ domain-containing protein [Betaproteobacteria bacterium]|nr:PilZ domain-containing protein [Betaproteobacteria bacterium]